MMRAVVVLCVATAAFAEFAVNGFASEELAIEGLKDAVGAGFKLDKTTGRALVTDAMERGWWGLSELLVDAGRDNNVDLSSTVYQSAAVIRRRLQSLTAAMGKGGISSGIAPAFEWAQSPESLFLNVKFAHKWDTPATLGCVEDSVQIEPNRLRFDVHCKDKRKKFKLDLDLHGIVQPDNSTWSMGAVGRATFTLKKDTRKTWPRLLTTSKKPGNMHVWWSLHDKYESENDKLEDEQRNQDRKAKQEAKRAKAAEEAANPTPTPEPTPTPTPEPTVDPVLDQRRKDAEKDVAKRRKDAEAKHKDAVTAIDAETRQKKRAIDDKASNDKKDLDDLAADLKAAQDAVLEEVKAELAKELKATLDSIEAEFGSHAEL